MALADPLQHLTEREYLAQERIAVSKSEFFDGEVFAMSGGSLGHSLIATNLAAEFHRALKDSLCVPFNSDLRLKIQATGLLTYPDLSVICGPASFVDENEDTVTNPTLLAEVLSDSTESYDRGVKFRNYVQIPTLRDYLLVSQREPRIEQFSRQPDGRWVWHEALGLEATLAVPSLEVEIALAEVYAKVLFPSGSRRHR